MQSSDLDRFLCYSYSCREKRDVKPLSLLREEQSQVYPGVWVCPHLQSLTDTFSWALILCGMVLVERHWETDRAVLERTFAKMKQRQWPICMQHIHLC